MIGLWPPPHNKTVSGKRLEKLRFPGFSAGQIFEFSSGLKPGSQSHLVWSEVEVSVFYSLYFPSIYFRFLPNLFPISIKLTFISIAEHWVLTSLQLPSQ